MLRKLLVIAVLLGLTMTPALGWGDNLRWVKPDEVFNGCKTSTSFPIDLLPSVAGTCGEAAYEVYEKYYTEAMKSSDTTHTSIRQRCSSEINSKKNMEANTYLKKCWDYVDVHGCQLK
jgi:hypothetical protein